MRQLFFTVFLGLVVFSACNSENVNPVGVNARSSMKAPQGPEIASGVRQLLNSQVCMVNDRYMGQDQIPVAIGTKVYYGCCEGCVEALKKDGTYWFGLDPVSHQLIDKATAIIILEPGSREEVVYFNSEENAVKYLAQKAKH